jgi:hypothetical protein
VALTVAGVDGGELENDDNAVNASRQGCSLCNEYRLVVGSARLRQQKCDKN